MAGVQLLGTHDLRLDEKGRLFLPARWRAALAERLVVTKGSERCLYVFPEDEFARRAEAMRTDAGASKLQRDRARIFFSSASDEVPDRQGRVTLPARLRDYAGLDRDVTVIGNLTFAEIWDGPTWAAYLHDQEDAGVLDDEGSAAPAP